MVIFIINLTPWILRLSTKVSQTSKPLLKRLNNIPMRWLLSMQIFSSHGESLNLKWRRSMYHQKMAPSSTPLFWMVMPSAIAMIWPWARITSMALSKTWPMLLRPCTLPALRSYLTGCQTKCITCQVKKWWQRLGSTNMVKQQQRQPSIRHLMWLTPGPMVTIKSSTAVNSWMTCKSSTQVSSRPGKSQQVNQLIHRLRLPTGQLNISMVLIF